MDWHAYLILGLIFGGIFFLIAIYALWWASRHGQLKNFEEGAQTIFDEEEPMGQQTDYFPSKRKRAKSREDARTDASGEQASSSS